ncbi:hypothetical protein ACFX1W_009863 [Malus domestica]
MVFWAFSFRQTKGEVEYHFTRCVLHSSCTSTETMHGRSTTWQAWLKICLEANFLVVCLEIHTALVLEASIMILFRNPKAWENKPRKPLHANLTA